MKQVLLLTDYSKNSKNAINYALQLFEKQTCTFHVLNTQKTARYTTSDLLTSSNTSIYNSLIKKNKQKLDRFVKNLEEKYQNENYSFKTIVDYDDLTDAINQYVEVEKIELIVMGTNGVTGAKEVVFGSNTLQVIRKVDCTTLVIPESFEYRKPKKILLPLDLLDSLNSQPFMELLKFVKKQNSALNILRIKPNGEVSKEEVGDQESLENLLNDIDHTYNKISHVPLYNAVDMYQQLNPQDLIALLVQKESAFERFFVESSTKRISYHLRIPLLIYHSE